jgi:inosine-uridine nucleoside N-ribohydrolase
VQIRGVVCSHLAPADPFDPGPHSARNGEIAVRSLFERLGLDDGGCIVRGAATTLRSDGAPNESDASRLIVAEALRDDTELPLFVACGGGLTDVASALLEAPEIADRFTLVWIGGPERGNALAPPDAATPEYNLAIDLEAGHVVLERSEVEVWQIPRDVYRQCLVSDAELRQRVRRIGPVGRFLYESLDAVWRRTADQVEGRSETYALGDSPLVLLTALLSHFEPDASSSRSVEMPAPQFASDGSLLADAGGSSRSRGVRVFTAVDTRLMFEDLYSKLALFEEWRCLR